MKLYAALGPISAVARADAMSAFPQIATELRTSPEARLCRNQTHGAGDTPGSSRTTVEFRGVDHTPFVLGSC